MRTLRRDYGVVKRRCFAMTCAVRIRYIREIQHGQAAMPLMRKPSSPSQKRDSKATRARLLEAARVCFTRDSYEHVGLRDIANEAGVNSTLIGRYFGSKEALFSEAVCESFGIPPQLFTTGSIADGLARWILQTVPDERFNLTLALIRSAPSPVAGPMLRHALDERFIGPLAERLDGDEARLRAAVMSALTLGACVLRDVLGTQAMRDSGEELLVGMVSQMLNFCSGVAVTPKQAQPARRRKILPPASRGQRPPAETR